MTTYIQDLAYEMGLQGERDGIWAWQRINQLFNWLPLAALIEKKIICMHGGIGRSINHVQQIEALQRPITMEAGSVVLMDLLWYRFCCCCCCFRFDLRYNQI